MPEFRVNRATVNLGQSRAIEDLAAAFCVLGTKRCLGNTIYCLFPTNGGGGCCGPFWSNPGGVGNLSDCGISLDCFRGTVDITITRPPTGCGLNYSTCAAGSRFDPGDLVQTVNVLEELQVDLKEASSELAERVPEIQRAMEPHTAEQLDEVEVELKAALDRVAELRREIG